MAKRKQYQRIPTSFSEEDFNEFILPHLTEGTRGPKLKIGIRATFNYIMYILYTGCQWAALPITKGADGKPEVHYSRIYKAFRRWEKDGCFNDIFFQSVKRLHKNNMLDTSVVHGDGTSAAAKKGATILAAMGTSTTKAIRWWRSAIGIAMF